MAGAKHTKPMSLELSLHTCRHIVVAGGVACNQHIRGELLQLSVKEGLELVLPPPKWCTDNGVMVAWAGHERCASERMHSYVGVKTCVHELHMTYDCISMHAHAHVYSTQCGPL